MLTICYVTGRRDNQVRWLFDSLHRELAGDYRGIQIVVVDFWAEAQRAGEGWTAASATERRNAYRVRCHDPRVLTVTPPAPNVWQGPSRRTREHFYAKSNALNTAVMHAKHSHLLFIDDLSVLSRGFFGPVREALRHPKRITAFAYDQHNEMVVRGGEIISSKPRLPRPRDHRVGRARGKVIAAPPEWTYGGALLVPLETALEVNGWPQDCDGMRSQDCAFGIVAGNAGYRAVFDPRAVSIESSDHHSAAASGPLLRGCSSAVHNGRKRLHVLLDRCRSWRRFSNYYGSGGLRSVRADVLAGKPVPSILEPKTDWFTGARLEVYDPGLKVDELRRTSPAR